MMEWHYNVLAMSWLCSDLVKPISQGVIVTFFILCLGNR